VAEPPASPHPPLPAGQYRFPFNNSNINPNAGDGCPDIDLDNFGNGADACPALWRDECAAAAGSDEDVDACECGSPRAGGKARAGCYQCTGQPHHLQRKPCNVTAYRADDRCGRYPPITRRQIIERALGWVSNGFLYGTLNRSAGGGTPETCSSEDETRCPQYSYESVCNGLLEMAWKSDDTNTGAGGKKKSWPPATVDCLDVRPGDWLHTGHHMQVAADCHCMQAGATVRTHYAPPRLHLQMFRRWLNGSGYGKQFVLYQVNTAHCTSATHCTLTQALRAAPSSFRTLYTAPGALLRHKMGGGWGKANAAVSTFSKGKYGPCYRRPNIVGDEREREGTYCSTAAASDAAPASSSGGAGSAHYS
jgi:hypothetical protein